MPARRHRAGAGGRVPWRRTIPSDDWRKLASRLWFDARMAYSLRRDELHDGEETTVYIVGHPLDEIRARVVLFRQPRRLDWWCAKNRVDEAIVGGFYRRDPFRPLGDLWLDGRRIESEPFPAANRDLRPALHMTDGEIRIAPRGEL